MTKIQVTCEICDKTFDREKRLIMNHIFCSKRCFGVYRSISQTGIPKSEEIKQAISKSLMGKLIGEKNPNYRGGEHGPLFGTHIPEERKQRISASNKGRVFSEETRKKMGDAKRGRKQTPEHVVKRAASRVGKKCNYSEESRIEKVKRVSGENNPNWKGGIGYLPYCPKFNEKLKKNIRNMFNNECFICKCMPSDKNHSIHHVDYNKNTLCNGRTWGLIPLCSSCHIKTNFNRWYWFNLLSNYWVYKYLNIEVFV